MIEPAGSRCPTCDAPAGREPHGEPFTFDIAVSNATRLLAAAEGETNLPLMERLEKLADSWANIAGLLIAREQQIF